MSEPTTPLVFASAVTAVPSPDIGDAALVLSDRSAVAKWVVRAGAETNAARTLPRFGTSERAGDVLVAGSRPGEWLMLGAPEPVADRVAAVDTAGHVSLVDLTHSRAMFRLAGAQAPHLLEKVCSLDWTDAMMPDGAVVSAFVAKVTCDIVRRDDAGTRGYLLLSDRSSAQYLFDALVDAGSEFAVAVGPPKVGV